MTLAPFLAAPAVIQTHIIAALVVLVLTPIQFFGFRKGSGWHRTSGYLWLLAMTVVSISSFWITESGLGIRVGPYGPIHLLSITTMVVIALALYYARIGRANAHRKALIFVTVGFLVAVALTLTPDRILGRVVFGT